MEKNDTMSFETFWSVENFGARITLVLRLTGCGEGVMMNHMFGQTTLFFEDFGAAEVTSVSVLVL